MTIRLVVLDCDRTLWDHQDVCTLTGPFARADEQTVKDARGERVSLAPGARELLDALRQRGVLVSICSWNRSDVVLPILDLFGLTGYFVHPKVELHPHKDRMISTLLAELAAEGAAVRPQEVLFVDDNPTMLDMVRRGVGSVRTLRAGVDIEDLRDVLGFLE